MTAVSHTAACGLWAAPPAAPCAAAPARRQGRLSKPIMIGGDEITSDSPPRNLWPEISCSSSVREKSGAVQAPKERFKIPEAGGPAEAGAKAPRRWEVRVGAVSAGRRARAAPDLVGGGGGPQEGARGGRRRRVTDRGRGPADRRPDGILYLSPGWQRRAERPGR